MRSVRRTSTSSSVGTTRRRNIEEVTLLYLAVELDRVKNALEKKFGTGQPPEGKNFARELEAAGFRVEIWKTGWGELHHMA